MPQCLRGVWVRMLGRAGGALRWRGDVGSYADVLTAFNVPKLKGRAEQLKVKGGTRKGFWGETLKREGMGGGCGGYCGSSAHV